MKYISFIIEVKNYEIKNKAKEGVERVLRTIIMDGAMGTYLKQKGIEYKDNLKVNINNPQLIKDVHEEYIRAGAEVICTNTFTSFGLLEKDQYDEFELIIDSALKIAWNARNNFKDKDIKISLDFGPVSNISYDKLVKVYKKAFKIIRSKNFDYLMIETQYDLKQTIIALEEFRKINKQIILSFTFNEDHKLYSGEEIKKILEEINKRQFENLHAIGANCSCGPKVMFKLVDEFKKYSNLPIIIKPNLGNSKNINGELKYDSSFQEFKSDMSKVKEKGVTFLGGCCGTNPQYIESISSL